MRYAHSDLVSRHCPLTPETRGLIGARRLGLIKPTAHLVNTAEGQVVDEAALARAAENVVAILGGSKLPPRFLVHA